MYAIPSQDTIHWGDILSVDFMLGDVSLPVSGFYGLAFTYNFDPLAVDPSFTSMSYGSSWIGTPTDKISLSKILNNTGQIKTAVTRIDHTTRSGNGLIATAKFRINTTAISHPTTYYYSNIGYISDLTAIDQNGNTIPLISGVDTTHIIVYPNGTVETELTSLYIYPNPAQDKVFVAADGIVQEIVITDLTGQRVINDNSGSSSSASLDIASLTNGIYMVHVKTSKGSGFKRLTVSR